MLAEHNVAGVVSAAETMQWVGATKVGETVPSFLFFYASPFLGPALGSVVLCTPCISSSSIMILP